MKNTYYTTNDEIARTRECNFCGWKWWTIQEPEESLLPELCKVVIPRWGDGKEKLIEIKKL